MLHNQTWIKNYISAIGQMPFYVYIKNCIFQEQFVHYDMILIWCGCGVGEKRYAN